MTGRNRAGLTLVEVFVIVVVLGMLLVLLPVPYLANARAITARRMQCMDQSEEPRHGLVELRIGPRAFPRLRESGRSDERRKTARGELGRADPAVYGALRRVGLVDERPGPGRRRRRRQSGRLCVYILAPLPERPYSPRRSLDTRLSYVVNCGLPGDGDTVADGVFHNHDVDKPVLVSIEGIRDGAAMTLLLSENVQAGRWTDTGEADLGMVWRHTPEPCGGINECLDAGDRPSDLRYARPSSYHPGLVIATFCDGHVRALDEGIDYRVYQHLMTPDSAAAGVSGKLDEGDF